MSNIQLISNEPIPNLALDIWHSFDIGARILDIGYLKFNIKPYYLCCSIQGFEQSHQEFKKIALEQNIVRPIAVIKKTFFIIFVFKEKNTPIKDKKTKMGI